MITSDFSQLTVYKDSQLLRGVVGFEASELMRSVKLYEYHSAEPYASVNSRKVYELKLEVYSDSFCEADEGFELTVLSGEQAVTYSGCNVVSVITKKEGQLINIVKISAEKRTIE